MGLFEYSKEAQKLKILQPPVSQKHLSRKLCSFISRSESLQCFASVPAGEKVELDGNNEKASEKMYWMATIKQLVGKIEWQQLNTWSYSGIGWQQ